MHALVSRGAAGGTIRTTAGAWHERQHVAVLTGRLMTARFCTKSSVGSAVYFCLFDARTRYILLFDARTHNPQYTHMWT